MFRSPGADVDTDYLSGQPEGRQDYRRQQPERVRQHLSARRRVLQLQVGLRDGLSASQLIRTVDFIGFHSYCYNLALKENIYQRWFAFIFSF